jgi:ketosteroid isomerase-like protein
VATEKISNAELVRRGYDAFNRGDLDAVLDLFDPEIEIGLLEDSPMAGDFRGHAGFRAMIAENAEMFTAYRNEPEEVIEATDEAIVVVIRSAARGRASGAEVEGRLAHLWTIRDGKVVRFQPFASREDALRAALD